MDENMTIGQVLKMAVEREVQAVQFYVELASRAEDPTMIELYHKLAEEEFKHKSRLELEMMKEGLVVQNLGPNPASTVVAAQEFLESLPAISANGR